MYISNILIKNYRGIKEQSLSFSKYNTLIGMNDCGKSTIINAVKLFFDDGKVSPRDFNYYQENGKIIEIEITLSEYNKNDLKTFLVKGNKENGFDEVFEDYVLNDSITIYKQWVYKEDSEVSSKMNILVNSFKDVNIYENKKVVANGIKKYKVDVPVEGIGNNTDLEKLHHLRLELIRQGISREYYWQAIKWTEIKDNLPSVELFKADQSIETTTADFKSTFTSEIKHIIQEEREKNEESTLIGIENLITNKIADEGLEIQRCMSEHISGLEKLAIKPKFTWEKGVEITDVDIKLVGDDKPIPLENKGSGYRRLFMVGRLRYLADKKHLRNVIYLVEEPETFLHPSAQEEMRDSLLSLSESNQVLITTHSPIFLGATNGDAITLCKKVNTDLIYEQRSDEEFLIEIARQIGVKPSHNIFDSYKTIIFVEGSNDALFLKIASKKLGLNFHKLLDSNRIVVFDGGGKSLTNIIDMKYFESLEKNMFLIIDSDKYDPAQIINIQIRTSFDRQQLHNQTLLEQFESKNNSQGFILQKKNIENYYHPNALRRKLDIEFEYEGIFADDFCVTTMLKDLKAASPNKNIAKKNHIPIYEEMTKEEWEVVSNGELEAIFEAIESSVVVENNNNGR